ncbi:MAG: hypothetical protein ABIP19_09550 [Dermatophilaceae bacterium]
MIDKLAQALTLVREAFADAQSGAVLMPLLTPTRYGSKPPRNASTWGHLPLAGDSSTPTPARCPE